MNLKNAKYYLPFIVALSEPEPLERFVVEWGHPPTFIDCLTMDDAERTIKAHVLHKPMIHHLKEVL